MAAFTTVAAGIGLAVTAGTTAMSFAQAGKQKKLMKEAEASAATAMEEARKKLQVNVYDKLAIQKEPYELQREAMLSQGAQAIQAGVESERGAEATAGRVQMAMNEGQAGIRSAMGQDMQQLEMLSAQEDARNRDIGVQLDLEEVAGAQLAAANAQELGAQATQQGFQGVTSLASQFAENAPLFERNRGAEKGALANVDFSLGESVAFKKAGTGAEGNIDLKSIANMDNKEYRKLLKSLSPAQRQMLFSNKQFGESYDKLKLNPFG